MIGRYVLVRTYSAGVHMGTLAEISPSGRCVLLRGARRLWRWSGANTLSEVSLHGVSKDSKISEEVEEIYLTEAIEILFPTNKARKSLESSQW